MIREDGVCVEENESRILEKRKDEGEVMIKTSKTMPLSSWHEIARPHHEP